MRTLLIIIFILFASTAWAEPFVCFVKAPITKQVIITQVNTPTGTFTTVPVLDENGDPVLDENGDPVTRSIPDMELVPQRRVIKKVLGKKVRTAMRMGRLGGDPVTKLVISRKQRAKITFFRNAPEFLGTYRAIYKRAMLGNIPAGKLINHTLYSLWRTGVDGDGHPIFKRGTRTQWKLAGEPDLEPGYGFEEKIKLYGTKTSVLTQQEIGLLP